MDNNLKIILAEFEQLKGQFVINHNRVERFIAIATDDQDYYYVTYDGKKCHWTSCLMGLVPLKGKIDDKHYEEFIRLAKLNDLDQPTFHGHNPDDIIKDKGMNSVPTTYKQAAQYHRTEIEHTKLPNRYLTEVCWDLN